MPPEKRNEGERDVAVRIQGIWIRPGDRLYADADGIVVLARRLKLAQGRVCRTGAERRVPADTGIQSESGRQRPRTQSS